MDEKQTQPIGMPTAVNEEPEYVIVDDQPEDQQPQEMGEIEKIIQSLKDRGAKPIDYQHLSYDQLKRLAGFK